MKTTHKLLALCALVALPTFAVGSAIAGQITGSKTATTEVKAEEAVTKTINLKITGMT